ncbi:MAG: hypothetical protein GY705_02645 [Bacteroidetes bacterium]|nr:hypothetical protein [Bacteroidota bacterium]
MKILFSAFIVLFSFPIVFAQSNFSAIAEGEPNSDQVSLLEMTDNDWSFYIDEENDLYYIDFETVSVNLSHIVVKNAEGDVLLRDDVFDLPVNTIYELDLSEYMNGNYDIELQSFTSIIQRKIVIE